MTPTGLVGRVPALDAQTPVALHAHWELVRTLLQFVELPFGLDLLDADLLRRGNVLRPVHDQCVCIVRGLLPANDIICGGLRSQVAPTGVGGCQLFNSLL